MIEDADKTGQRVYDVHLAEAKSDGSCLSAQSRISTRVRREPQENWLPLEAVPPCDTGLHVTKWFDHLYYDAPLVYSLNDVDNWRLNLCYAVLDGAL
jgi:hypothetical protein